MTQAGFSRRGPMTGLLEVLCWCTEEVVYVTPAVVRACLTESCGRPECQPGPCVVCGRGLDEHSPRCSYRGAA